jgi:hypothetical protein
MNTIYVIVLFVYCRNQENNVTQCRNGSIQCGTIDCIPFSPQRMVVYWWCAVCRPCCDVIQFHERCFAHIHCPRVNNFRKQITWQGFLRRTESGGTFVETNRTHCLLWDGLSIASWMISLVRSCLSLVWSAGWTDSILLHIREVLVFRGLRKIAKSDC